jgi:hypothetical protein
MYMGVDEYDFSCLCVDRCSQCFFTFCVLYCGYSCKHVLLFMSTVRAFSLALRDEGCSHIGAGETINCRWYYIFLSAYIKALLRLARVSLIVILFHSAF